jgi:hypothetical protein
MEVSAIHPKALVNQQVGGPQSGDRDGGLVGAEGLSDTEDPTNAEGQMSVDTCHDLIGPV